MIIYEWYADPPAEHLDELRAMLDHAAEVDDEAGFPKVRLEPVTGSRHLLVWLTPDERPGEGAPAGHPAPELAAYLRVEPDGDRTGVARYVVRPELRSRGVTTMLFEQLGAGAGGPDGWAGTGLTGLRTWARGDHPAADRLSVRLRGNVRRTHREWQLLAPLRAGALAADADPGQEPVEAGAPARPFAPDTDAAAWRELRGTTPAPDRESPPGRHRFVVPDGPAGATVLAGAVDVDPDAGQQTEYGVAGRIGEVLVHPDRGETPIVRALLVAAMDRLRESGLRVAAITVDSRQEAVVRECRLLGFVHDRTDVEYRLGSDPADGPGDRAGSRAPADRVATASDEQRA